MKVKRNPYKMIGYDVSKSRLLQNPHRLKSYVTEEIKDEKITKITEENEEPTEESPKIKKIKKSPKSPNHRKTTFSRYLKNRSKSNLRGNKRCFTKWTK